MSFNTSDGLIPSCDNCKWLEPCYDRCDECDTTQEPPSEWFDIKGVEEE